MSPGNEKNKYEVWNQETGDYAAEQATISVFLSQFDNFCWPVTADQLLKHLEETGAIHNSDIAAISPYYVLRDRKKSFSGKEELSNYLRQELQKNSE